MAMSMPGAFGTQQERSDRSQYPFMPEMTPATYRSSEPRRYDRVNELPRLDHSHALSPTSSFSSSSSYLDISRAFPAQRPRGLGAIRTFFTAPSERRLKNRRRRSHRTVGLSHINSSSSSLDSDLAYGTGYMKVHKRRRWPGRRSREIRVPDESAGHNSRTSTRRQKSNAYKSGGVVTDATLVALGAGIAAAARKSQRGDTRKSKRSASIVSYERVSSNPWRDIEKSRSLEDSRQVDASTDSEDWESASSEESEVNSVDSVLAYGHEDIVSNNASWGWPGWVPAILRTSATQRSTVVDPTLFGPQNTLNGYVDQPVGFGNVAPDFSVHPPTLDIVEQQHRESFIDEAFHCESLVDESIISDNTSRSLQHVYPIPTSDPSRFDASRSSDVIYVEQEQRGKARSSARPYPIPVQYTGSTSPDLRKSYDDHIRSSQSEPIVPGRNSATSRTKSIAGTAMAGLAMAGLGASIAAGKRKDRDNDRNKRRVDKELDRKINKRSKSPARSISPPEFARAERGSDVSRTEVLESKEDRRERRRRDKESRAGSQDQGREQKHAIRQIESQSSDHVYGTRPKSRKEDTNTEQHFQPSSTLHETRRDRRREERRTAHDGNPNIGQVAYESVDPFQFQVADDAFESPFLDQRLMSMGNTDDRIADVNQEPSYARRRRRSSVSDRYSEQEEVSHFTAPLAIGAITAAVAAIAAQDKHHRTTEKDRSPRGRSYDLAYDEESDLIQEDADRAYRELVLARELASRYDQEESSSPIGRVVTPPGYHEERKQGQFDAPNADFELDKVMSPVEYKRSSLSSGGPNFVDNTLALDGQPQHRPLLTLVHPTPASTPSPERQDVFLTRYQDDFKNEKNNNNYEELRTAAESVSTPITPKAVSWGENETKHFDVESPAQIKNEYFSKPDLKKLQQERARELPSPRDNSSWGTVATAVAGAVAEAATLRDTLGSEFPEMKTHESAKEKSNSKFGSEPSKSASVEQDHETGESRGGSERFTSRRNSRSGSSQEQASTLNSSLDETNSHLANIQFPTQPVPQDEHIDQLYDHRAVVIEPQKPTVTSPTSISSMSNALKSSNFTEIPSMPGSFDDDLEFAATLAAGLQDSGFNPDIVIEDPTYQRRTSPPGSSDLGSYHAPFIESVSDLGIFHVPGPSTPGMIIGEILETPYEDAVEEIPHTPKLSKKEQRRLDKASKKKSSGSQPDTPAEKLQPGDVSVQQDGYFIDHSKKEDIESTKSQRDSFNKTREDNHPRTTNLPINAVGDLQSRRSIDPVSIPLPYTSGITQHSRPEIERNSSDKTITQHNFYSKVDPATIPLPNTSDISGYEEYSGTPSAITIIQEANKYDSPSIVEPADIPLPATSDLSRYDDEYESPKLSRRSSSKHSHHRASSPSSRNSNLRSDRDSHDLKKLDGKQKENEKDQDRKSGGFFGLFSSPSASKSNLKPGSSRYNSSHPEKLDGEREELTVKSKRSKRRSIGDYSEVYEITGSQSMQDTSEPQDREFEDDPPDRRKRSLSRSSSRTRHSSRRDNEKTSKKDSFLARAGILGVGAGIAGAMTVLASQHQHENADVTGDDSQQHGTEGPLITCADVDVIDVNSSKDIQTEEKDPIVSGRVFRPSIDPQYGDLLPLPPSISSSPSQTFANEIDVLSIKLPDSRPNSPPPVYEKLRKPSVTIRKADPHAPLKSPSHSAIPLKFMMSRSNPTSPRITRGNLKVDSQAVTSPESTTTPSRHRGRPTSWDTTKEFQPLFLVDKSRRGSTLGSGVPEQSQRLGMHESVPSPMPEHGSRPRSLSPVTSRKPIHRRSVSIAQMTGGVDVVAAIALIAEKALAGNSTSHSVLTGTDGDVDSRSVPKEMITTKEISLPTVRIDSIMMSPTVSTQVDEIVSHIPEDFYDKEALSRDTDLAAVAVPLPASPTQSVEAIDQEKHLADETDSPAKHEESDTVTTHSKLSTKAKRESEASKDASLDRDMSSHNRSVSNDAISETEPATKEVAGFKSIIDEFPVFSSKKLSRKEKRKKSKLKHDSLTDAQKHALEQDIACSVPLPDIDEQESLSEENHSVDEMTGEIFERTSSSIRVADDGSYPSTTALSKVLDEEQEQKSSRISATTPTQEFVSNPACLVSSPDVFMTPAEEPSEYSFTIKNTKKRQSKLSQSRNSPNVEGEVESVRDEMPQVEDLVIQQVKTAEYALDIDQLNHDASLNTDKDLPSPSTKKSKRDKKKKKGRSSSSWHDDRLVEDEPEPRTIPLPTPTKTEKIVLTAPDAVAESVAESVLDISPKASEVLKAKASGKTSEKNQKRNRTSNSWEDEAAIEKDPSVVGEVTVNSNNVRLRTGVSEMFSEKFDEIEHDKKESRAAPLTDFTSIVEPMNVPLPKSDSAEEEALSVDRVITKDMNGGIELLPDSDTTTGPTSVTDHLEVDHVNERPSAPLTKLIPMPGAFPASTPLDEIVFTTNNPENKTDPQSSSSFNVITHPISSPEQQNTASPTDTIELYEQQAQEYFPLVSKKSKRDKKKKKNRGASGWDEDTSIPQHQPVSEPNMVALPAATPSEYPDLTYLEETDRLEYVTTKSETVKSEPIHPDQRELSSTSSTNSKKDEEKEGKNGPSISWGSEPASLEKSTIIDPETATLSETQYVVDKSSAVGSDEIIKSLPAKFSSLAPDLDPQEDEYFNTFSKRSKKDKKKKTRTSANLKTDSYMPVTSVTIKPEAVPLPAETADELVPSPILEETVTIEPKSKGDFPDASTVNADEEYPIRTKTIVKKDKKKRNQFSDNIPEAIISSMLQPEGVPLPVESPTEHADLSRVKNVQKKSIVPTKKSLIENNSMDLISTHALSDFTPADTPLPKETPFEQVELSGMESQQTMDIIDDQAVNGNQDNNHSLMARIMDIDISAPGVNEEEIRSVEDIGLMRPSLSINQDGDAALGKLPLLKVIDEKLEEVKSDQSSKKMSKKEKRKLKNGVLPQSEEVLFTASNIALPADDDIDLHNPIAIKSPRIPILDNSPISLTAGDVHPSDTNFSKNSYFPMDDRTGRMSGSSKVEQSSNLQDRRKSPLPAIVLPHADVSNDLFSRKKSPDSDQKIQSTSKLGRLTELFDIGGKAPFGPEEAARERGRLAADRIAYKPAGQSSGYYAGMPMSPSASPTPVPLDSPNRVVSPGAANIVAGNTMLQKESDNEQRRVRTPPTPSMLPRGISHEQLELARQMREDFASASSKTSKKGKRSRRESSIMSPKTELEETYFNQGASARGISDVNDTFFVPPTTNIASPPEVSDGFNAGYSADQLELAKQMKEEFATNSIKKIKKGKKSKRSSMSAYNDTDPVTSKADDPFEQHMLESIHVVSNEGQTVESDREQKDGFASGYNAEQLQLARQMKEEFAQASTKRGKKHKNRGGIMRSTTDDDVISANIEDVSSPHEYSYMANEQVDNLEFSTKDPKEGDKVKENFEKLAWSNVIGQEPSLPAIPIAQNEESTQEPTNHSSKTKGKKDKKDKNKVLRHDITETKAPRPSLLESVNENHEVTTQHDTPEIAEIAEMKEIVDKTPLYDVPSQSTRSKAGEQMKGSIPSHENTSFISRINTLVDETVEAKQHRLPPVSRNSTEIKDIVVEDHEKVTTSSTAHNGITSDVTKLYTIIDNAILPKSDHGTSSDLSRNRENESRTVKQETSNTQKPTFVDELTDVSRKDHASKSPSLNEESMVRPKTSKRTQKKANKIGNLMKNFELIASESGEEFLADEKKAHNDVGGKITKEDSVAIDGHKQSHTELDDEQESVDVASRRHGLQHIVDTMPLQDNKGDMAQGLVVRSKANILSMPSMQSSASVNPSPVPNESQLKGEEKDEFRHISHNEHMSPSDRSITVDVPLQEWLRGASKESANSDTTMLARAATTYPSINGVEEHEFSASNNLTSVPSTEPRSHRESRNLPQESSGTAIGTFSTSQTFSTFPDSDRPVADNLSLGTSDTYGFTRSTAQALPVVVEEHSPHHHQKYPNQKAAGTPNHTNPENKSESNELSRSPGDLHRTRSIHGRRRSSIRETSYPVDRISSKSTELAIPLGLTAADAVHSALSGTKPLKKGQDDSLRIEKQRTLSFNSSLSGVQSARSASGTPPLRRSDRQISGGLRSLSQQKQHDDNNPSNSTISLSDTNPVANEGRIRAKDMTDVYDGFGEGRIGSPRSPTRPHSMRRRQSTQVLDLEAKLEHMLAENRLLVEAKQDAERKLAQRQPSANLLADKDAELDSLKNTLDWLHKEVERLKQVNVGLTSANDSLAVRYTALETEHRQRNTELRETREASGNINDKDDEITRLRQELESAQATIRSMQQQILLAKASDTSFLTVRDEDYFDDACQQLCQHVQQWVLRFSKFSDMRACRLTSAINNDKIIDRLDNAILDGSDVDVYLSDRIRRRDIFMSMTMTMIWEFIFTRYLFGMDRDQRQKLKSLEKILTEVGPPAAVHQWRAITLTLLAKRSSFKEQCEQDTEAVVQMIYTTLSAILPPPTPLEDQIQDQLRRVIHQAVNLSIEMRTQRAEYMMLPPLQPEYDANGDLVRQVSFNAALMNERSDITEGVSNADLEKQGAVVRIVLFPLVVKRGDDNGAGDEEIVVCQAQVLVVKPKREGRGIAGTAGASRTSVQSSMPDRHENMI